MAKLQEEILVIKVSKLLRDSDTESRIISEDNVKELEAVIQQLTSDNVLVEITSE